jgi:hypothetical protein
MKLKGKHWVNGFAVVFLARLLGPLWGMPPLTASEASMWAMTIGSYAFTNQGPKEL